MYIRVIIFTSDLELTNSRWAVPSTRQLTWWPANAGVTEAIVSFYRVNSDTAFERHRSRIPINDLNTVHALKKHLIQFLGLKELTIKYGLGDFDNKLYRMAPKPGGKSDNFAMTYNRRPVEAGASKYAGWRRKRNEQYVFLVPLYLFHVVV